MEINERIINEVTRLVAQTMRDMNENVKVECNVVTKNNDTVLHGLTFTSTDSAGSTGNNMRITPIFYIENYRYASTVMEIAANIISDYQHFKESLSTDDVPSLVASVGDFDKIKDKLRLRLINKANNKKVLETVPYLDFLDLAVIPVIEFDAQTSTKVTQQLVHAWEHELFDVFYYARNNTFYEDYLFKSMNDIFLEMGFPKELLANVDDIDIMPQMYILSNQTSVNGAIWLYDKNTIKQIADKLNADLMVLPSSIHESIIIPMSTTTSMVSAKEMTKMVQEVNNEAVAPNEKLSDHVYIYLRESGWLKNWE